MVIDTSALAAILLGEPSRDSLLRAAAGAARRVVSAVSLLEAGMVLRARSGEAAPPLLFALIDGLACEVAAFDRPQAERAIAAFGRFGKGMGHRAQLNFGDCAVYALAAELNEPILAIGNDFKATGISVVRLSS
jgi:ribonuclease VapC